MESRERGTVLLATGGTPSRLSLVVCDNFRREVEAVVHAEFSEHVTVETFPAHCPCVDLSNVLESTAGARNGRSTEVWGGPCLGEREHPSSAPPGLGLVLTDPCPYLVAGKTLVDELAAEKACVVTPGWLQAWHQRVEAGGWDLSATQTPRCDSASAVVLLDTCVYPALEPALEEFSRVVGLPARTVRVGLDYLSLRISLLVREWQQKQSRSASVRALARAQLQWAHFEMLLDLVGSIARLTSEEECAEKVLDLYEMLFAPEHLALVPVRGGELGVPHVRCGTPEISPDALRFLDSGDGDWLHLDTSHGFRMAVAHGGEILALVVVNGLRFPQYLAEYRMTSSTIAGVCGLAIANARAYQRLVQTSQAQKLESIGRLAAGIAHEINTPLQYASHNISFLGDAFRDLQALLEKCGDLASADAPANEPVASAIAETDVDYLFQEIPLAIQQGQEGIERVSRIVLAMKEFAHPGFAEKSPVDLNRLLDSTITVCRNEWRHVADLVTEFDLDLPPVPCLSAELSQVFLNLVVNAAHAIADVVGSGAQEKGTITVSTRRLPAHAEIRFSDTGTGISEAHRDKVFDPFFTTKEVGKGTGQGLALSRSVVVGKHGGTLTFDTAEGRGTVFTICLPFAPSDPPA